MTSVKQFSMFTKGLNWLVGLAVIALLFNGCQKDTAGPAPDNGLEISAEVKSASKVGWQTINQISTQDQMFGMTDGIGQIATEEEGLMYSLPQIRDVASKALKVRRYAARSGNFSKTNGDSLIWFEEWNDPVSGTAGRRALYYDQMTGEARVYQVVDQFPDTVRVDYDSTEIQVFVGPDLDDESDDLLRRIDQLTRFDATFEVSQISGHAIVTDYDAQNEVSGATAVNEVIYGSQTEFDRLTQNLEFNPDNSGQVSERLDYRDGTFLQRSITTTSDYNGSYSETWRDGTTVNGVFDLLEDDNHALFTRNIDFATHPWVNRLEQAAEVTLNPGDSSSNGQLVERIFFNDGNVDTTRIEVDCRDEGEFQSKRLQVNTSNNGQSDFTIREYATYVELDGRHIDAEGHFILFNGVSYASGSGELWLRVYASETAYNNGEPPLLELHIIYHPDGSGKGQLTEAGKTYDVKYSADGKIEVTDPVEGEKVTLSGY